MPEPKSWPLRVRTESGESVPVLMRDPATGDTAPVQCSAPGLEPAAKCTGPLGFDERKGPDGRYCTAEPIDCNGDRIVMPPPRPMTGDERRDQLQMLRKWAKDLRAVGAKEHRRLDWIERIHLQGLLDEIDRLSVEEETSDHQGSSSRAAR